MTREEYETIIGIINKDIATSNLEDLKKLKSYLSFQIEEVEEQYLDTEKCYDILTMKLKDYLYENITSKGFKKTSFLMEIKRIKKLESYDEIYVFDTIGISRKVLLKGNGIGEKLLAIYEDSLREYGIERHKRIHIEEREKLDNFRKHEKRKIK